MIKTSVRTGYVFVNHREQIVTYNVVTGLFDVRSPLTGAETSLTGEQLQAWIAALDD